MQDLKVVKCLAGGYNVKLGHMHIHNFNKKSEAYNFINKMKNVYKGF